MRKAPTFIILLLTGIIGFLSWALWIRPVDQTHKGTTEIVTPAHDTTPTKDAKSAAPQPLHEKITVSYPKANAEVPKHFTVTGKAPGNWFFEASAPVMVQAEDGSKIAQGIAKAQGDWMTTNLVAFTADISTNPAYVGPATLVLLKDNPSGLPENDDSLEIPITIK